MAQFILPGAVFGKLFPFGLDHFFRRVGDEFFVRQLLVQARDLLGGFGELFLQPFGLGRDVDQGAERQTDSRLANDDLRRCFRRLVGEANFANRAPVA